MTAEVAVRPAGARAAASSSGPDGIGRRRIPHLALDLVAVYRQALPGVVFGPSRRPARRAASTRSGRHRRHVLRVRRSCLYVAYVGRLGTGQPRYDRLRVIADLGTTPVQLLVRRGLRASSIPELRGLKVSIGLHGNATEITVDLLLRAFGMRLSDLAVENLSTTEAGVRLAAGTLDAAFSNTIYPADALRVATRAGARLIPLTGAPIERLRHDYPFFRVTMIPRYSYPVDYDVLTVGVDSLIICRRIWTSAWSTPDRTFFDSLPALSSGTALRMMDVGARAADPAARARRYYEQEVMR